jgi:hypothetical protein
MNSTGRHFFQRAANAYFVFAVVATVCSIMYFTWLAGVSPKHPIADTGHIYQLNNHGSYSYATKWQAALATGQFWIVASAMLIKALGDRLTRGPHRDPNSN